MVRGPLLWSIAFSLSFSASVAQTPSSAVTWIQFGSLVAAYDRAGNLAVTSPNVLPGGSWGIGVDGQRRVWVSNYATGGNTVSCFTAAGALVGTFPAGPATTGLSSVGPLAIDALDHVYVGDPRQTGSGTITKLDASGMQLLNFPVFGVWIRCLAIDVNGDLWILLYSPTAGHRNVQKYSPNGTFLLELTPGSALVPNTLFADEWGRIAISHNPGGTSVSLFDVSGMLLNSISGMGGGGVAIGPDGRIWCTAEFGTSLAFVESGGTPVPVSYPGVAGYLTGIAFDAYGDTWISQWGPNNQVLRRLNPSGTAMFSIAVGVPTGTVFNQGDMTGMLRARVIDPHGDMDGDGFQNLDEAVARSSPLDSSSVPVQVSTVSPPVLGTTMILSITAPNAAGAPFFAPFSTNGSSVPLAPFFPRDRRSFPISIYAPGTTLIDPLWDLSVGPNPFAALIFPNTNGLLDAAGAATVNVHLPFVPSLSGFTIHAAFCTLTTSLPAPMKIISRRLDFTLQ